MIVFGTPLMYLYSVLNWDGFFAFVAGGALCDAQRASELCDVSLASGHIADYRAWQTKVADLEAREEEY
jgi:hypothetical protein